MTYSRSVLVSAVEDVSGPTILGTLWNYYSMKTLSLVFQNCLFSKDSTTYKEKRDQHSLKYV